MWYVMLILFLDVLCILNIIFKFNSKKNILILIYMELLSKVVWYFICVIVFCRIVVGSFCYIVF